MLYSSAAGLIQSCVGGGGGAGVVESGGNTLKSLTVSRTIKLRLKSQRALWKWSSLFLFSV